MKTRNRWGTWLARAAATSLVLLLQACQTGYQAQGPTGGYTEQRIADDTYYVTFAGNGKTPKEVVERYFIYRCAELTREKGYKYFVVLRTNRTGSLEMPRIGEAIGESPWRSAGLDAGAPAGGLQQVKGGGGGGYYYVPGGTYYITTWTGRATIRMLNESNLQARVIGYVADDVMKQVGPYIKDRTNLVDMPGPAIIDPVLGAVPLKPAPDPEPDAPGAAPKPPSNDKAI